MAELEQELTNFFKKENFTGKEAKLEGVDGQKGNIEDTL